MRSSNLRQNRGSQSDTKHVLRGGERITTGPQVQSCPRKETVDYVKVCRIAYGQIGDPGDPGELLMHVGQMVFARNELASPGCNTPEKKSEARKLLLFETEGTLATLAGETLKPVEWVTKLAKLIREMAPKEFDAWVDQQFSGGFHLGLVAAVRNPADVAGEREIEQHLARGELAAAAYLPVLGRLSVFAGILRVKLEADLGVETADEQMELDLAIDAYLTARRLRLVALSLDGPIPRSSDLIESLKLRGQERIYNKVFQATTDRIRARVKKRTRKVVAAPEASVSIRVCAAATVDTTEGDAASA